MDNSFNAKIRLFITICCFCYSVVLFSSSSKDSAGRYLGLSEFFLGLWNLFDALQEILKNILFSDPNYILLLQSLIYVVAEFACVSALLFVKRLFVLEDSDRKRRTYAVFLFPLFMILLVAVFVLFTHGNPFLKTGGYPGSNDFFLWGYYYPKRPLYYVHCVYCYAVLALSVSLVLRHCVSGFRENKRILLFVAVCLVVFILPSVYKVFFANSSISQRIELPVLFDAFCIFFATTGAFLALHFDFNERSVSMCKNQMYESLRLPIFVFNKDEKILHVNEFAWKFLQTYKISIRKFDAITAVFPKESLQVLGIPDAASKNAEFYFSGVQDRSLYHGRKIDIAGGANRSIGSYVILSKIDFYTGIIRQLEKAAYTCEVTGFRKRDAFEHLISGELQKHSETVCVVFAAVKGLSKLNESIGLKKTDMYIKKFSLILRSSLDDVLSRDGAACASPEIFRLAGSLFGFLLPISAEAEIPLVFKEVRAGCSRFSKNKAAALLCSLGYSVASGTRNSVDAVFQKSYQNMLLDGSAHPAQSRAPLRSPGGKAEEPSAVQPQEQDAAD
ncbi:MAG: hypothetical protein K2H09_03325 [Treponemataceae bacterium]|nr:hypothetical protein [Treponemataceae bacterium]